MGKRIQRRAGQTDMGAVGRLDGGGGIKERGPGEGGGCEEKGNEPHMVWSQISEMDWKESAGRN